MGLAFEQLICEVLAVTVRLARLVSVVPKFILVAPLSAVVPEPKFMVLVLLLLDAILSAVKLYVAQEKDPLLIVKVFPPVSSADPRLHEQSTPSTVMGDASATPFVVNVNPVELLDSVIVPPA